MSTAQKGYYETIKLLLNYCPDINTNLLNAEDNNGFTALMLAARSGHPEIVKLLLERGANDDKGKSAMLLATMRGHLDIVQLLLDHHADINLSDDNGYTTLSLAVECEIWTCSRCCMNEEPTLTPLRVSEILMMAGQPCFSLLRPGIWTLSDFCWNAAPRSMLPRVITKITGGLPPLLLAVIRGFADIVTLLLKYGARGNDATEDGKTALMIAAQEENQQMSNLPQEYCTGVNAAMGSGSPPLIQADGNANL